MHIDWIASTTSDNFFYLLHDSGHAALVDPVDHALAIERVRALGLTLDLVVNTHWHPDHVSGDDAVLAAFPDARLAVPAAEADTIANLVQASPDVLLAPGDTLAIGDSEVRIISIPGHTQGHIGLSWDGHLVSGDAIFAAGAGNVRFGGDPGVLFQTFRDTLRTLPPETLFYPGHDYCARNLAFSLSLLPELQAAADELARAEASPERTLTPRSLGQEREYNLFMRYDDPALDAALRAAHPALVADIESSCDDPHEVVFRALRSLRDSW